MYEVTTREIVTRVYWVEARDERGARAKLLRGDITKPTVDSDAHIDEIESVREVQP